MYEISIEMEIKHILFQHLEGGSYETVQTIDSCFMCLGRC